MNHQHRESSFRRYEPLIKEALEVYPDMTYWVRREELDNYKLPPSLVTCSARCRDAINSLLQYGWATEIDVEKLKDAGTNFQVAIKDDGLIFGTRAQLRVEGEIRRKTVSARPEATHKPAAQFTEPLSVLDFTLEEVRVVATLAKIGALRRPIRVLLTPNEVEAIENNYGIAILPDGDHYQILP